MLNQVSRRNLLGGVAGSLRAAGSGGQGRPNVLFVFLDQLRAQDLGCNGGVNCPTPNIDRLASQGVMFTNALSTSPMCTPYRAMLQTGRWPTLNGGVINFVNVPSTGQSIADVFARSGYDTGFIGKWHLAAGRMAGTLKRTVRPSPGPECEFVPPGPARMGYQHWEAYNFHEIFKGAFYYKDTPQRLIMPGFETDAETDMAIAYMRGHNRQSKPFFLMVAPHPPHTPWRRASTPEESLARIPTQLHQRPNVKLRRDSPDFDPRCYYALLNNADDNIGRLLRFMDEAGLSDNTILVFTSDHGDMLGSHGRYKKNMPYAEVVDVPLIIRWPKRIRAGSRSDALFTPMDHFPTLASMCGLPIPEIVNGMDLSAAVLGGKGPERDSALMMNFSSTWDYPETGTAEHPEWRAVRTRQHTYVRWLNGAEELYDNHGDPYQMRNLFDGRSASEVMLRLRSRMRDLLAESHDPFLPGDRYQEWFTPNRDLIRNALGPVRTTL